jgi:hypothetical protein
MTSKSKFNSYEEYLAALQHDQKVLQELDQELQAISDAEQEILESLAVAEKHLQAGTEEGYEKAMNQLRMLFSVVELAEMEQEKVR